MEPHSVGQGSFEAIVRPHRPCRLLQMSNFQPEDKCFWKQLLPQQQAQLESRFRANILEEINKTIRYKDYDVFTYSFLF